MLPVAAAGLPQILTSITTKPERTADPPVITVPVAARLAATAVHSHVPIHARLVNMAAEEEEKEEDVPTVETEEAADQPLLTAGVGAIRVDLRRLI